MPKEFTIALAGSPNSGKTTIFNSITGSRQHVGNYPGVTVEQKSGLKKYKDYLINLVDLPGTYSLTAYSMEEVVARDYILNNKPEIILNIVDSSNLERNLYLATQLIELETPLIIVFNMSDVLLKAKEKVDIEMLSSLFGAPVVLTVGSKSRGIEELLGKAVELFEKTQERKKIIINYGEEIENEIYKIKKLLKNSNELLCKFNLRWLAVKILEQDKEVLIYLKKTLNVGEFLDLSKLYKYSINHIKNMTGDYPEVLIAEARYGFINGALKEAIVDKINNETSLSDRVDRIVINKVLGLPIFILIMWIMFQVVFKLGNYPVEWLTSGLNRFSGFLNASIPDSLLKSLLLNGIIGGVGGILVFTPKIMLLFIFIAILEDSGYMSRGAFIMDRIMHKIGLHGKSFIPFIIGFGCTIPAYMCGRTLENKSDRMITMHVNTFMSCGGRLPVYILFAGIFFPKNAGNIIFSLYIIGILMAVAMAKLLRVTRFKGEAEPFVMELPSYRLPTLKGVFIHMWERTWQYIKKAGTIILALSVIMWVLFTFPMIGSKYSQNYSEQIKTLNSSYYYKSITADTFEKEIQKIKNKMSVEKIEYSAAGRIGHFIEPVFKPLGFDWRLSLASLTGIAGKEVVVSTIGTLFSLAGPQNNNTEYGSLIDEAYNPLIGYNFMLFTLLYFPCVASLAVFKKEAGIKEMIFQIFFTLSLAWIVSFVFYQTGRWFI